MTPDLIFLAAAWFLVFLFSTTLHEAAHALVAQKLGDETAYLGGQVSLNPLPHIQREPFGMVVVPLVSFFLMKGQWMIGWASAPYDPRWAHRFPKKSALMALGGPVANLSLVLLAGLLIRLGLSIGYFGPPDLLGFDRIVAAGDGAGASGLATVLSILFSLNLVLFVFNLLPLPPLDGSGVIQLIMSDDLARRYQGLFRQPMWGLVGIVVAWRVFGSVFGPVFSAAISVLYPELSYG